MSLQGLLCLSQGVCGGGSLTDKAPLSTRLEMLPLQGRTQPPIGSVSQEAPSPVKIGGVKLLLPSLAMHLEPFSIVDCVWQPIRRYSRQQHRW